MLLNSISLTRINPFTLYKANSAKTIPFTSGLDSYNFKRIRVENAEFANTIPYEVQEDILMSLDSIVNFNASTPIGNGAKGLVYQQKNVPTIGPDGIAIKIAHSEEINPETGEKQKVGTDYDKEIEFLKKVESLKDNSQQFVGRIKFNDGRSALLTTFVRGQHPDAQKHPLTSETVASFLTTLSKLDSLGVLHRDLKKENLLVEQNQGRIIDFGEAVDFDLLDYEYNDNERHFPRFMTPTNLQNFEDTFITPYYEDLKAIDEDNAKEFYRDYLQQKAVLVHKKRASQLEDKIQENFEDIGSEKFQQLGKMQDYEFAMFAVLSSPKISDEIVNIELMKNQITFLSELAYKNEVLLANPLANVSYKASALIAAKKMELMVKKQMERPNHPLVKKYLDYQYEIAKYRQQKIAGWTNGLVNWFLSCMVDDVDTQDVNKKELIKECTDGKRVSNFQELIKKDREN